MARKLFELTGKNPEWRFSPFVWRSRLALYHKGLDFEGIAWNFTDKAAIEQSGQGKVPVLVDGDQWISDSWNIACHLDQTYPDQPRLIPQGSIALMHAFNQMVDAHIHALFRPLVVMEIYDALDAQDQAYFRQTREPMLGKTLEAYAGDKDQNRELLWKGLSPFEPTLKNNSFFGGDHPNYADHIMMGAFMWAKCTSDYALLPSDHPFFSWRERMLDQYGAKARTAAGFVIKPL